MLNGGELEIGRGVIEIEHDFVASQDYSSGLESPIILSDQPIISRIEDVRRELDDFTPSMVSVDPGGEGKERKHRGIESLSIVIPALNEEHYLPKLLSSLDRQEFAGDLQVVVVDGKSNDRTVDVASNFKDRLDLTVISSERGIGRQRNAGAEIAKHQHLLFLDADVIVPRNMLNRFAAKINPKDRIVDTVVLVPHPLKFFDTVGGLYGNLVLGAINMIEPAMTGAFLLTTKDNHSKVGGFAEGAIIGEDLDYVLRSARDGAKTHKHMSHYVFSSTRRGDHMGRAQFMLSWVKAYLYVRRNGPIYDNFYYPYGDYK